MPSSCNEKKNEAKQMCDLEAIQKQAHTHFAKAMPQEKVSCAHKIFNFTQNVAPLPKKHIF